MLSPVKTEETVSTFRVLNIPAHDAHLHPHALRAMFDDEMDGLLLRGAFNPALMDTVSRRIDAGLVPRRIMGDQAHLTRAPFTIGQAIVGYSTDLEDYFADGALQGERLLKLFEGHVGFDERIAELLSALCGGLPVDIAPGPDGKQCPSATIRVLPAGGEIGVHVDNSFLHMPRARHLQTLLDTKDQLSYFVPLSVPEGGGELMVYNLEWAAARFFMPNATETDASVWLEGSEVFDIITQYDCNVIAPGVGDLLVFDGGRHFHRVSKVTGATPRRTIGGFLGFSPRHDHVYVWS